MVLLVKIDGEMGWVSTRAKHDQSVSPCYFSIFCLPVLEHQGHENARQLRNLRRRSGSQAHFGTFDAQKLYYKQKPIELTHNIYIYIISAIFCNGVCSTFIISPCTVHGLSLRVYIYMCVCVHFLPTDSECAIKPPGALVCICETASCDWPPFILQHLCLTLLLWSFSVAFMF